jgi:hypothetical protein
MGLFKKVVKAPSGVPLAILGISALSLAGCGGIPPPAATAVPTAVATAAPTPTPTPNLIPAAAAAYLAAATTANAADAALSKAYPAAKSMSDAQAKTYWTRAETIDRTFLTAIFAIAYPPLMKSDVDAQIAAQTKVVSDEGAMVYDSTGSNAQYNTDLAAVNADSATDTGTANVVRHDLGLPQVPLT